MGRSTDKSWVIWGYFVVPHSEIYCFSCQCHATAMPSGHDFCRRAHLHDTTVFEEQQSIKVLQPRFLRLRHDNAGPGIVRAGLMDTKMGSVEHAAWPKGRCQLKSWSITVYNCSTLTKTGPGAKINNHFRGFESSAHRNPHVAGPPPSSQATGHALVNPRSTWLGTAGHSQAVMPVLPSHSLKIWLPWLAGLVAAAVSYLPLRHLLGRPRLQKGHPSEPMKQPATDDTK